MSYPNNEGPQKRTLPLTVFTSCNGCKYHSQRMIRSGREPLYSHNCGHPDTEENDLFKIHSIGNLHENSLGIVETPRWCPFLTPKPTTHE